ncbi:hypothetical protein ASD11_03700 [Aeromicrobium sp. Root495]|uniref:hypothetical protein n=1 Tax=Aeromicrobium sp. Root495 TaxID=1736550 RepID=UPI0006FFE885|nr:hypothetical protein [Aeromicrobium sp. Root495]KQY58753.1 hypothetical protein ASD11_03700 [Aeromicrobium sp. Root495]
MRRLGLLVALLIVLTACGGSSGGDDEKKDPLAGQKLTTVLAKARTAATEARFLTVRGEGDQDGRRYSLNLYYVGDTTSGSVDNTFGTLSLLRVDGDDYATPSFGFFYEELGKRSFELEDVVDGRWIALPDNEIIFLHRADLVGSVLDADGPLKRAPGRTLYGIDCVGIEHDGGTVYVSPEDGRAIQAIDGEGNVVNFEYDRHEEPTAPERGEVVDARELTQFGTLKV